MTSPSIWLPTQMKLSRLAAAVTELAAILICGIVYAADSQQKTGDPAATVLPPVETRALRDPVEKSYRRIVRGMDVFEQRRSLAPNAPLRFKLLPRRRDTDMQAISLSIISDNVTLPVPVAEDNTFALPRSRQALDEDAVVTPDRKSRSMTWRADIRTPGLPPNTRRLGDLRLECWVGMEAGLVSNSLPFFGDIANVLRRMQGYCSQREVRYLFFAERPLFGVTLVAGNRREVLSVHQMYAGITRDPMSKSDLEYCDCEVLLDRTYYAPLGDPSWPDDTLIQLEYMDDVGGAPASSAGPAAALNGPPR
jgi:hypothetical protein